MFFHSFKITTKLPDIDGYLQVVGRSGFLGFIPEQRCMIVVFERTSQIAEKANLFISISVWFTWAMENLVSFYDALETP